MNFKKLSQKHKLITFTVLLCIGFIVMASFITIKVSEMTHQYEQSGVISQGASTLFETQTRLLRLSADTDGLTSQSVNDFRQKLELLMKEISEDAHFLKQFGLEQDASQLKTDMQAYNEAIVPWVTIKGELGFSENEGLRGRVNVLRNQINKKIKETGMVTVVSEYQAFLTAQQNFLQHPDDNTAKLYKRAKFKFVNISKSYSMLDAYEKELDALNQLVENIAELSDKADKATRQVSQSQVLAQSGLEKISSKLIEMSHNYQNKASAEAKETQWSVLVACVALAVVTIIIFVMISMSLTRSLKMTQKVLVQLSQGDLSQRMPVSENLRDEFNQLAMAINHTCQNLGTLVRGVQNSSDALSGDAATLNQGLDKLVEDQSNVLHQTEIIAAATEEVSATAQEVSNSLERVADVSRESTSAAQNGSVVIEAAIKSLEEVGAILNHATQHTQRLDDASQKVDSVMEIINGIAEQTNLLALNAAIEAARAGEQGRGFAVVADEVRTLAVRTVEAVADISQTIQTMKTESSEVIHYIEQSENTVREGQEKGIEARKALGDITDKANEATNQTEVIVSSIQELAKTSHSMADNMVEISSLMKKLDENNSQLRETSQGVDERSSGLTRDCQQFII